MILNLKTIILFIVKNLISNEGMQEKKILSDFSSQMVNPLHSLNLSVFACEIKGKFNITSRPSWRLISPHPFKW